MRAHDLSGLEPDNFLAFLTLLGLLRALETAEPSWKPRAFWTGVPLRPRLLLDADVDRAALAEAAVSGIVSFGATYAFDADDIKFSGEEFRALADSVTSIERGTLLAALCSDGAMKRDGKAVEATPLCMMLGSGHQYFLRRLSNATTVPTHPEKITAALFEQWTYRDTTESFRWDPIEDRRYAYQSGNPSDTPNKVGTVTGANRLAALAFGVWSCAPGRRALLAAATNGRGADRTIRWPLNSVSASLTALLALLSHPDVSRGHADPNSRYDNPRALATLGVKAIVTARRYQNDKYFNVSRGYMESP